MFTQNLKELRLSFGLTQKEMADEIGTSQQAYGRLENGINSPTLRTIEKIAELFDIPISTLVSSNTIQVEDILNAEYINFNGNPLSQREVDDLKSIVDNYATTNLKHLTNVQRGGGFKLKSGKMITWGDLPK
ncbi:helix-turn-helix domain-containing protein [Streptococcus sp. S784/96/1]|uniref:helix-turn-helix domain-containing protein n=1 Tax=Streptococcus sp. S784/96/1 TaxID=2653499 RepID=UPI001386BFDC|nr:helix-turn-helix transcriptional regulator [Streptococcus sp. S784/96/1]